METEFWHIIMQAAHIRRNFAKHVELDISEEGDVSFE